MVVLGLRFNCAGLTNLPVIALRPTPCVDPPSIFSTTVVFGLRFACAFVTKRPDPALRALVPLAISLPFRFGDTNKVILCLHYVEIGCQQV